MRALGQVDSNCGTTGSVVEARGLQSTGSVVVGAQGLEAPWHVESSQIEVQTVSPASAGGSLSTV